MVEAFLVLPGETGDELRLVGDFDVAGVATFDDAVDAALDGRPEQLTLDLGGITFLASAGLACLLRTVGRHRNLQLRAVPEPVLELLDITGTRSAFTIVEG